MINNHNKFCPNQFYFSRALYAGITRSGSNQILKILPLNFEINFESDKILKFDNSNEQGASFRANLDDKKMNITKNKENIATLKTATATVATVSLKSEVPKLPGNSKKKGQKKGKP